MPTERPRVRLMEIAKVFLTIGATGFGGGMAMIAMMQDYCVRRRRWLDVDEFSHGIAFGQILGPFAVNVSIFVGYRLRGWKGAVVAATAFLAPSVILVMVLTELYLRFQSIPSLQSALKGIGPVVVALIVAAAYQIGRDKVKSAEAVVLVLLSIAFMAVLKLPVAFILLATAAYAVLKVRFAKGGGAK